MYMCVCARVYIFQHMLKFDFLVVTNYLSDSQRYNEFDTYFFALADYSLYRIKC